jgi:DNA-directed RNA polymerase alpha subunit
MFNTRRSQNRADNLLKLEINRVVSITRKQKVKMAVTIYIKGLSHFSKLRNSLGVYIHRSLRS